MSYEGDPEKEKANYRKHGIHFADATGALEDERALTIEDDSTTEKRFKTPGTELLGRIVVVAYTYRVRRHSTDYRTESEPWPAADLREGATMKTDDFTRGKRGAVVPAPKRKTRITIRIDDDVLDWFREQVNATGGGNYQTMINRVLREHIESHSAASLEKTLRRVIREELRKRGAA